MQEQRDPQITAAWSRYLLSELQDEEVWESLPESPVKLQISGNHRELAELSDRLQWDPTLFSKQEPRVQLAWLRRAQDSLGKFAKCRKALQDGMELELSVAERVAGVNRDASEKKAGRVVAAEAVAEASYLEA